MLFDVVPEMNLAEEITEVFSILHDGTISSITPVGADTRIEVEIEYLASRIDPGFRTISVQLEQVEGLLFSPWSETDSPPIPDVTQIRDIAGFDLGILSAETADHTIRVACSQFDPEAACSGGFLQFRASGYCVFDESGHQWALPDLGRLSDGYWDEFQSKS